MEEANEVQEALSRSYGTPEIDDDELEAGPDLVQLFFLLLNSHINSSGVKGLEEWSSISDSVTVFSELDALGDELELDDDTSYLDEASAAPSIPEGMPSDSKTNKVEVHRSQMSLYHTDRSVYIMVMVICNIYIYFINKYFDLVTAIIEIKNECNEADGLEKLSLVLAWQDLQGGSDLLLNVSSNWLQLFLLLLIGWSGGS